LTDVRRITDVCDLPLLVDVDTGFGASAFNIARTTKSMIKFGAAAMHIEDQVGAKRCGHRPNKAIVTQQEMVDRIKAAVDARTDENFVIMARTDALQLKAYKQQLIVQVLTLKQVRICYSLKRSLNWQCTSNLLI
jgi:methylisocitrate lyase